MEAMKKSLVYALIVAGMGSAMFSAQDPGRSQTESQSSADVVELPQASHKGEMSLEEAETPADEVPAAPGVN